jgi:hypothetical protein
MSALNSTLAKREAELADLKKQLDAENSRKKHQDEVNVSLQ